MTETYRRVIDILACPECHVPLEDRGSTLNCSACGADYPVRGGVPRFTGYAEAATADSRFQTDQMFNATPTARLYNLGRRILSSEYMRKDHMAELLAGLRPGAVVVELGSGNRRLRDDVVNLDLFPLPNVDLVADVAKTPFTDGSVDFAIVDTVLEHVPEPHRVTGEIHRILKPGGRVACFAPWIFPYHGYPKNYFNISRDGLEYLFRDFAECTVETSIGPSSALTNLLSEYVALAFSGERKILYTAFKGLSLLPIFLFKYLDRFWAPKGKSNRIAATLCAVARK